MGLRRAKATKRQRQYKRDAGADDFARMVAAASAVVIRNRGREYRTGDPEFVLFKFPFWVKFDKDFPKGHIVDKDLETNTHKINAMKLLDWLYSKGYSTYDSAMLVKQTKQYEILDKGIDRLLQLEGE